MMTRLLTAFIGIATIPLAARAEVIIKVLTADGKALAGAKVEVWTYPERKGPIAPIGKTNNEGEFPHPNMPMKQQVDFWVIVRPVDKDKFEDVAFIAEGVKDKQVLHIEVPKRLIPLPAKAPK